MLKSSILSNIKPNSKTNKLHNKLNPAFTIIELLIVIVIIAILVAIVTVSYNGITKQAKEASLKSDLKQASTQLQLDKAKNNTFPSNTDGLKSSQGNTFAYTVGPDGETFCLIATNESAGLTYGLTQTGTIKKGGCKNLDCPENYVEVPGNPHYGTNDFCVMKYEAKILGNDDGQTTYSTTLTPDSRPTGTPWVNINQTQAKAASQKLGSGYHLMTEPEWMTLAMNLLSNPQNWTGNAVGSGSMYNGHVGNNPASALAASPNDNDGLFGMTATGNLPTQNNKRTLTLSNGEVIWDISGNVSEWTDATIIGGQPGLTGQTAYAWNDYSNAAMQRNGLPNTSWPTGTLYAGSQGVGRFYSNPAESGLRAFYRGGGWHNGSYAGVLRLGLDYTPAGTNTSIGFRVSL